MKIVHIVTHLGGGVGTVLRNWIKNDKINYHTILCLRTTFYGKKSSLIQEDMLNKKKLLYKYIKEADIVIVHFWNHPALYDFLINFNLPKCRLCVWSHISGFNPPYIFTKKLLKISDVFIFSSPISFEAKEIKECNNNIKSKLRTIWTTGGHQEYNSINKIRHKKFNIGYIGTLDFSKIHEDFTYICTKINRANTRFIICGDGADRSIIENQFKQTNLDYVFTGRLKNIKPILSKLDLFIYPLTAKHFGTCEQIIGEIILAKIPIIVLNNSSERYILNNVGLNTVSSDIDDFIKMCNNAYDSIPVISEETYIKTLKLYDINTMIAAWNNIFNQIIIQDKSIKKWPNKTKEKYSGDMVFFESLGNYGKIFIKNNKIALIKLFNSNKQWFSKSKGSILQYLNFFPKNKVLTRLYKLISSLA